MTTTILTFTLPPYAPPPELTVDGAVGGPEFTYQPAHVSDGLSLLLSQFDDSTNLRAVLAALLKPAQALEDSLATHYAAFDVDTAEGVLLDILGGIVGERRFGRADSEYRAYVKARIAANASDGSATDIYRVVRLVLGDVAHALRLETLPPAHFRLYITGAPLSFPWDAGVPSTVVAKALASLVTDASSVGVSFNIWYQATDDANAFTCSSSDAIETSSAQGCANDAGTVGGSLIDAEGGL